MATSKLATGILGCLLVYVAVLASVFLAFGWAWMLVAFAAIPLTAYADLVVIDRGASVRKHAATLLRLGSLGNEVEDLRSERERLSRQVAGVVNRLRRIDPTANPSGRYSG